MGRRDQTPLIGRTRELAFAGERLAAARHGEGGVLVIAGEAGIGKSRLVREIGAVAQSQGFQILQGACFETDRTLPYAPFLDLLRVTVAGRSQSEIIRAFGPAGPDLAGLLPELAAALPGIRPASSPDPEAEKRRLFDAFAAWLTRRAAITPIVLVIEDLHWSDDTSLELLRLLARRGQGSPVLLLATYRNDEVTPSLEHTLAELARERHSTEIVLPRLEPPEVQRLVRATAGSGLTPDRRDAIVRLSDGNPFFAEELAASLVEAGRVAGPGDLTPPDLPIPRSIADAVRRRVERLPASARETLVLAAVAGRRFDFDLLAALTDRDEPQLVDEIKALIAAQLVVEESSDRFVFRHALTRQAVLSGLLARERRAIHRRVVAALDQIAPEPAGERLADLAYHAAEAGAWEKAIGYAQRAGEAAQARFDPRAAAEQFSRAIAAARALGHLPLALYQVRGKAYELLGEFDRAQADFEDILSAKPESREAVQALLDLGFLWVSRDYARAGGYFQQAVDQARDLGDPTLVAHGLNRLGNWLANDGRPDLAEVRHQEALAIFEELGDRPGIAESIDLLGTAAMLGGDTVGGAAYHQQAAELFEQLGDRVGLASSLAMGCYYGSEYQIGNEIATPFAASLRSGERSIAIAREIDWRAGEAFGLNIVARLLGSMGEYARAFEVAEAGLAAATEIGHRQWHDAVIVHTGQIYHDLLAFAPARRLLEPLQAGMHELGSKNYSQMIAGLLAWVLISDGDLAGAAALLDGAQTPDDSFQFYWPRLCWRTRAELALAEGDPDLALALADRLIAATPNLPVGHVIPGLWWLRGRALAAQGRQTEAVAVLESARDTAIARSNRPLLWRILTSLSAVHRRYGRLDESERSADDARAVILELAANVPETKLDDLGGASLREHFVAAAMAQLPRPSPRRAAKRAFDGLTDRERAVAAQVAAGKTNRQIAEALVLSESTVITHLKNIFAKLGYSSRSQVAAWATEHGLRTGELSAD